VCALLGLGLDSFADHEDKKYDLKKNTTLVVNYTACQFYPDLFLNL
jgi:hypothetical protein